MASQHAVDEAGIRQQIDRLVEAIRAGDLEGLKPMYARDVVSFDAGGSPLQHVGSEAKWGNWAYAFKMFQPPLGYEVRSLAIALDGDVAFAHSFNRLSGTLKTGNGGGFWVRVTYCFRKIGGNWLIAHDHVSAPLDVETGKASLNLEP